MRRVVVLLALLPALTGCLGVRMEPLDIDVDLGEGLSKEARLEEAEASFRHDALQGRIVARVWGEVRTSGGVEDVEVRIYLVEGACPKGPVGEPRDHEDRRDVELGAVSRLERFEGEVSAPALSGAPMSVRVLAYPSGLGPNFAACVSSIPVPA